VRMRIPGCVLAHGPGMNAMSSLTRTPTAGLHEAPAEGTRVRDAARLR
jgi:hypothetical protein